MSEDYTVRFYGAASSIRKDLADHYRKTEGNLSGLHIWSTKLCETVVVLLDFKSGQPMVGTLVRVWQRFIEDGSQLYYWKEVDVDCFYQKDSANLLRDNLVVASK
jgi:hypothetical protein